MVGQRIGYVRVSTLDQNDKRLLDCEVLDRVFTDEASGRDTARPQLTELLRLAQDGDTVVVHSMDRLARNLDDLRALVQGLTSKGVRVDFVKENLAFTGEDSPWPTSRHRPGQAARRLQGRKKTLTPERAAELVQRAGSGVAKALLVRDYGISRETVYQYLRHAKLGVTAPLPATTRPRGTLVWLNRIFIIGVESTGVKNSCENSYPFSFQMSVFAFNMSVYGFWTDSHLCFQRGSARGFEVPADEITHAARILALWDGRIVNRCSRLDIRWDPSTHTGTDNFNENKLIGPPLAVQRLCDS